MSKYNNFPFRTKGKYMSKYKSLIFLGEQLVHDEIFLFLQKGNICQMTNIGWLEFSSDYHIGCDDVLK